jgi:hypothetical protein
VLPILLFPLTAPNRRIVDCDAVHAETRRVADHPCHVVIEVPNRSVVSDAVHGETMSVADNSIPSVFFDAVHADTASVADFSVPPHGALEIPNQSVVFRCRAC